MTSTTPAAATAAAAPSVQLASGHRMPLLGFGTWGGGDDAVTVAKAAYHALRYGHYRHIDGAQYYLNEAQIGEQMEHFLAEQTEVKREDLFLTSKVWNTNHGPEHVRGSVLKTLADLRTPYLDLLLIHWPIAWEFTGYAFENGGGAPVDEHGVPRLARVPLAETWRAMEQLVDEGLVRSIGVSNFSVPLLHDLRQYARHPISVNQVELHPYLTQSGLLNYCRAVNVHVTAFSPLGRPGRTKQESCIHDPLLAELSEQLTRAHNEPCSPAALMLAWGIRRGTSVLPKSSTPARVVENYAQTLRVVPLLTDEMVQRISQLNRDLRYVNTVIAGEGAGQFKRAGPSLFE